MNSEENSITINDTEKLGLPVLFFDTYAFFEILKGNENYSEYVNSRIITTKLNLFELYLKILREESEENAGKTLGKYYSFAKDFDEEVIAEAAKLKIKLNKRDVSMTDCIGYCYAKQLGVKFLTGDDAFEKMENVEFVK